MPQNESSPIPKNRFTLYDPVKFTVDGKTINFACVVGVHLSRGHVAYDIEKDGTTHYNIDGKDVSGATDNGILLSEIYANKGTAMTYPEDAIIIVDGIFKYVNPDNPWAHCGRCGHKYYANVGDRAIIPGICPTCGLNLNECDTVTVHETTFRRFGDRFVPQGFAGVEEVHGLSLVPRQQL